MSGSNNDNASSARVAVILAAGKGTRMKSELPKVATPLMGRPLLLHVLENVKAAGIERACIIVGYKREEVQALTRGIEGIKIDFAFQEEQKGTAHAFLCSQPSLEGFQGSVLVASGDMPMLKSASIRKLLATHANNKNRLTVLSAKLDDPMAYGRLVRDEKGSLKENIEYKDASEEIRAINEANTGTYVFEAPEIFEVLKSIDTDNAQGEYYLPDAISIYYKRGENVGSMPLDDPTEALGVNSVEELEALEKKLRLKV